MINENEAQQIKVEITNNLENLNAIKVAVLLNEDTMLEEIIPELKKEKSEVLSFTSPKLNGGEYELKAIVEYELKGRREKTEERRKLFVKRKVEEKEESAFDEELNKLLGE